MKYKINYGTSVAAFPKSALDVIKRAGEGELKLLLYLCANEGSIDEKKLSRLSGLGSETVREAISFWRGAGVIEGAEENVSSSEQLALDLKEEKQSEEPKEKKKKLERSEELPNYTSSQLSSLIEARPEITTLIDECQNILGKVFNLHEINVLIGLVDYLSLDLEYIMVLLKYCVSIGRKTLHYAEKLAFGLYDAGICTSGELSEELRRRELSAATEGKIRSLFGLGERAFTSNEKKFISAWVGEMGYNAEIISKAYEITVDTTTKPSMKYTNAILERWHAEGLDTLEKIEESYKKNEKNKTQSNSTFTDDFFDAAVRRALGDN